MLTEAFSVVVSPLQVIHCRRKLKGRNLWSITLYNKFSCIHKSLHNKSCLTAHIHLCLLEAENVVHNHTVKTLWLGGSVFKHELTAPQQLLHSQSTSSISANGPEQHLTHNVAMKFRLVCNALRNTPFQKWVLSK